MKRNFNQPINNINGENIKESPEKTFSMKDACLSALLIPQENDDKLDGKKKCELVELAMRINANDEVDLSADEIVLLKQRIAKVPFNTHIITYRVHQFLEDKGE